jgi:hypothetical protein
LVGLIHIGEAVASASAWLAPVREGADKKSVAYQAGQTVASAARAFARSDSARQHPGQGIAVFVEEFDFGQPG